MAIKITQSAGSRRSANTAAPGYEPSTHFGGRVGGNFNLPDAPNTAAAEMQIAEAEFRADNQMAATVGGIANDAIALSGKLKSAEEEERAKTRMYEYDTYIAEKEQELLREKNEWDHPVEWYETELKTASDSFLEKVRAEANFTTHHGQQVFNNMERVVKNGFQNNLVTRTNQMRTESWTAAKNKMVDAIVSSAAVSRDFNTVQAATAEIRNQLSEMQRVNPMFSDEQLEAEVQKKVQMMASGYVKTEALNIATTRLPDGTIVTGADHALDIIDNSLDYFESVYGPLGVEELKLSLRQLGEGQAQDLRRGEAEVRQQEALFQESNAHKWQLALAGKDVGFKATETQLIQDLEKKKISDAQFRTLLSQMEKGDKETMDRRTTVERTLNNLQVLNPDNKDDRKAANEYFEKEGQNAIAMMVEDLPDDQKLAAASEYTFNYIQDTGVVLDIVREDIARKALSLDPEIAAAGSRDALRIIELGDTFANQIDERTRETAVLVSQGISPTEAAKLIHEGKNNKAYPIFKKEYEKEYTLKDSGKFFEKETKLDLDDADPSVAMKIKSDFHNITKEYYAKYGGNIDAAKKMAGQQIKNVYGEWEGQVMMYPPSKAFPGEPPRAVTIHYEKSLEQLGVDKDTVTITPVSNFNSAKHKAYHIVDKETKEVLGVWQYNKDDYAETKDAWIVGVSKAASAQRVQKETKRITSEVNMLKAQLKKTKKAYKDEYALVGSDENLLKSYTSAIAALEEQIKIKEKTLGEL